MGGKSVYIPPKSLYLQIFRWLLVVFLFDPGEIVVAFEIGMTSYPPNEIPGYAPAQWSSSDSTKEDLWGCTMWSFAL